MIIVCCLLSIVYIVYSVYIVYIVYIACIVYIVYIVYVVYIVCIVCIVYVAYVVHIVYIDLWFVVFIGLFLIVLDLCLLTGAGVCEKKNNPPEQQTLRSCVYVWLYVFM